MSEKTNKLPVRELRGLAELIHDAVEAGVGATEKMHLAIASKPFAVLEKVKPIAVPAQIVDRVQHTITVSVYQTIRTVNRFSGALTKQLIDRIEQSAKSKTN